LVPVALVLLLMLVDQMPYMEEPEDKLISTQHQHLSHHHLIFAVMAVAAVVIGGYQEFQVVLVVVQGTGRKLLNLVVLETNLEHILHQKEILVELIVMALLMVLAQAVVVLATLVNLETMEHQIKVAVEQDLFIQ
jgi:hypothetical protein